MNTRTFKIRPISLALLLTGIGIAPASYAADLVAIEGQWSPDGGATQIPMWGFASDTGQDCDSLPTWTVGPQLTATEAGNLSINLRNCLSEPVSMVIPGQPANFAPVRNAGRVIAFTSEASVNGGTESYSWANVKSGTYLYQSGSHPAKQVQMGLYGVLTVGSYPDTSGDVTMLYSEIDPALHGPSPAAATPLNYNPRHYLVNGLANQPSIAAGDTNKPTVLRFLNAGLDFHVPALNGGYMTLMAEDGNPYPFAKQQYSVSLAAGKTIDALWQPASEGDHVIYDRRGNGMVAKLSVSDGGDIVPPVITLLGADSVDVAIGATYTDAGATATDNVDGDLGTLVGSGIVDTATAGTYTVTYTATDVAGNTATLNRTVNVVAADAIAPFITLNGSNPVDLTVSDTYTDAGATATDNIDGDLGTLVGTGIVDTATAGIYTVTYTATDMAGNTATLSRTVNVIADIVAPVITLLGTDPVDIAVGDTYVDAGATATDNVDGDLGTLTGTGTVDTATSGTYTVTYTATDIAGNTSILTRTVNVAVPVNNAPVAVGDSATVVRRSVDAFINLTDNDTDADNNLKDVFGNVAVSQINITTGLRTTRRGSVAVVPNGVNYTPRRSFRGTDTFNYTVTDLDGVESNEVTVRVNVVRR